MTRDDVLNFIKDHPGCGGTAVQKEMRRRVRKPAWVLRWFGEESAIVMLLYGPSLIAIHQILANLEARGHIVGLWVPGPYPRRRIYISTKDQAQRASR